MYDVIIMDFTMPVMNGNMAAAKIFEMMRTHEIKTRLHPYIVCASAFTEN